MWKWVSEDIRESKCISEKNYTDKRCIWNFTANYDGNGAGAQDLSTRWHRARNCHPNKIKDLHPSNKNGTGSLAREKDKDLKKFLHMFWAEDNDDEFIPWDKC